MSILFNKIKDTKYFINIYIGLKRKHNKIHYVRFLCYFLKFSIVFYYFYYFLK